MYAMCTFYRVFNISRQLRWAGLKCRAVSQIARYPAARQWAALVVIIYIMTCSCISGYCGCTYAQ